ncbi:MAG: elongation factor Ts [Deltaproteobacteria bacterium]|nr:elongation factor Ts [Deltaproteobacteria bacterium]MBT4091067.1 elongation factor Ts [Deltaproteobacteria bacterium]MBT4263603.1 elongation factor Ts [Deltaproteobacteria bacterium]MBT4644318.1 elongation factor Ts [Deltaproteobacteria bacterium]MBT6500399.1 elongation factor Ts [Deltaproteobacteria bacterium]
MKITASMVKELREITGAGMMDCKKALNESDGDMEAAKEFLRKKGQAIANKKSSRETREGAVSISLKENKAALVKIACETDFVAINDNFKEFIAKIAAQAIEVGIDDLMEKSTSSGSIKEQFVEAIGKLGENIVFANGQYWEAAENGVINFYTHTNNKIGVLVELDTEPGTDATAAGDAAKNVAMHVAASQVEAISENDLDPAVIEKEKNFLMEQARESGKPENIIEKMVVGRLNKFKKEVCLLDQNYVKDPDKTISEYLAEAGKAAGGGFSVKRFYKETF